MRPEYEHRHYHSPEDQQGAIPGWSQEYAQLEGGSFSGALTRLELPDLHLHREDMSRTTMAQFAAPEGAIAIYFLRPQPCAPVQYAGFWSWRADEPVAFGGGQTELCAVFPETAFAEGAVQRIEKGSWDGIGWGQILNVSNSIERLLDPQHGAHYRDNPAYIGMVGGILHDQISAWFDQSERLIGRLPDGRRTLHRLLSWLRDTPVETLGVGTASAALGLSTATLRALCLSELDLSIEQVLIGWRLSLARRALLQDDGSKVSDVALDHGFAHWGRFSSLYRSFFGETPSATQRRIRTRHL